MLLAEHTTVPPELVREPLRPELGPEADGFTAEAVLSLSADWDNFRAEQPGADGDVEPSLRRLAVACRVDRVTATRLGRTVHADRGRRQPVEPTMRSTRSA